MSQKEGVKTVIGEKSYEMFMLPPLTAHELLVDFSQMVGPALGPVFDTLFSKAQSLKSLDEFLDQEIEVDFFTKASGMLFGGLKKPVIKSMIEAFKSVTFVDGVPLSKTFDEHFRGSLDEMYTWLGWGMKVQWGKSLGALVNLVRDQGAKMIPAPQSPSQST